jgi:Protein phosphatase 2C
VRALLATEPGTPGWPNEDFAAVAPGAAVLLDGAGSPHGRDGGCVHGVAWYARTLGGLLTAGVSEVGRPLREVLTRGIEQVYELHAGTCDLGHPATPSATVIMVRSQDDQIEYLVLGDSTLMLRPARETEDGAEAPRTVTDVRLHELSQRLRPAYRRLPVGAPERETGRAEYLAELDAERNRPGGYWVAATSPQAAEQAIGGTEPLAALSAIALLSDGASRLVDRYRLASWPQVSAILARSGPGELIRQVRAAEDSDADGQRWPRAKLRDDATAIYWPLS